MGRISQIERSDSDWMLIDDVSNSIYRECPFENYSLLPFYRHEIRSKKFLFEFQIEKMKTGYHIGGFRALPRSDEYSGLQWEPKIAAFEKALPLLKLFLTYHYQTENEGAEPVFKNSVKIQTFGEAQMDSVSLFLSGGAHFELSIILEFFDAFGVDNISAVKGEAKKLLTADIELPIETETLWYDFDLWMDSDQIKDFEKEISDLKKNWLTESAPEIQIFADVYGKYLFEKETLPDSEIYTALQIERLKPYFRQLS